MSFTFAKQTKIRVDWLCSQIVELITGVLDEKRRDLSCDRPNMVSNRKPLDLQFDYLKRR